MSFKFIKSQKQRDQLVVENYLFEIDKKYQNTIYWKCIEYRNMKCKGRVKTKDENILSHNAEEHNHQPVGSKIKALETINTLKEVAKSTDHTPQNIINSTLVDFNLADSSSLPSFQLLKKRVQRIRCTNSILFKNPRSINELLVPLPEVYTLTLQNEDFLLYDENGENRMIIFSTRKNMKILENSEFWFGDGTFKVAPSIFYQLYTIHAIINKAVIPLIYALLPNKNKETYRKFFEKISSSFPNLKPKMMMTDFEQAAIQSFEDIFPNAEQLGCHFHFGQSVWKKIKAISPIHLKYLNDSEFALNLRMLIALAYLPPEDVLEGFHLITQLNCFQDPIFTDLFNYYEDTWVGRGVTGRNPLFPIKLWNCFRSCVLGLPKTNNSVEAWHRKFNSTVGNAHPTIWRLIDSIKKEQNSNELKMEQILAGNPTLPQRKKYKDLAERLQRVVETFGTQPTLDYLRGIAHNVEFSV